jgi:hypothetical protein
MSGTVLQLPPVPLDGVGKKKNHFSFCLEGQILLLICGDEYRNLDASQQHTAF